MQCGGGAPLPPDRQQILPRQMEEALQRAIREQVLQDPEVQPNDHFLININSNRLRHSYHSARMRVGEWMNNDLRAQEVMQQISRMLNSNERFQLDDSFSLHISHIRYPGRGSGNRRIKKATMVLEKLLNRKKSVVKIKNDDDELCCAHAIVTMKAYCDFGSRDSHYRNLQQGNPAQGREAREPCEWCPQRTVWLTRNRHLPKTSPQVPDRRAVPGPQLSNHLQRTTPR